jgi:hypothetical protein
MVSTRKGLDTSLVDPKKIVRPRKIQKPVNTERSAAVDINEFRDDDDDDDEIFREFIASQIGDLLPAVDENGTKDAETQRVDMSTIGLNGVNASLSTNSAGLAPLESTGPSARPGPGGDTPCSSDGDGSGAAETDGSGTGEERCWASLAVLICLDSNPACLSSEDDDNSQNRTSSHKRNITRLYGQCSAFDD